MTKDFYYHNITENKNYCFIYMVDTSISQKNWGPFYASLYVTDENTIIVSGVFYDEETKTHHQGPEYKIADIKEDLAKIRQEHPHRYLYTPKWCNYIRELWEIVNDDPWFRYE